MLLTNALKLTASVIGVVFLLAGLSGVASRGLAPAELFDPVDGLYRTARLAHVPRRLSVDLAGLGSPARVIRDERGVPHIFAASDRDAVMALGFLVAQDRLFQLDFIPRAASGRLAEVLGPDALLTDRFMRSIGMDMGARKNAARIVEAQGVEWKLVEWYCAGVNAYIDALESQDLPFEMRLIGYEPDRCSPLQVARVLQFMAFDLSFRTDDAVYGLIRAGMSPEDYAQLYPLHAPMNEPIIPAEDEEDDYVEKLSSRGVPDDGAYSDVLAAFDSRFSSVRDYLGFGFEYYKGSNNWAVAGRKSATGAPILAGDMHLRVGLPAIWYEVHLVTPEMNLYGVMIPGAPGIVEAFNSRLAWAFTNTGSDQIDHVALRLDSSGTRYRTAGAWEPLTLVPDTILVRGVGPVIDTLMYSRWGPVVRSGDRAVSIRWVAHDTSRTLEAIWRMGHASAMDEFERAVRYWDSPMQNILYADVAGNIAIRSTGRLPLRADDVGPGLIDGAKDTAALWSGRVPFDELPFASNPVQGYLASANQEPAGESYPHYLGHDWRTLYRGLRINEILRAAKHHTVEDFRSYQADVVAVHGREFAETLSEVSCADSSAERHRIALLGWDGDTGVESSTPLAYELWIDALSEMAWDEPEFRHKRPYAAQLYRLLVGEVDSRWADIVATPEAETVSRLVCLSLAAAAQRTALQPHRDWGSAHSIIFRHLLSSDRFSALGRGPFPYPGTWETLSPAKERLTTHSASWRVVVDLSESPPVGYGVYPGGASGNPFSRFYDLHIPTYLDFDHYRLHNPDSESYFDSLEVATRLQLNP